MKVYVDSKQIVIKPILKQGHSYSSLEEQLNLHLQN